MTSTLPTPPPCPIWDTEWKRWGESFGSPRGQSMQPTVTLEANWKIRLHYRRQQWKASWWDRPAQAPNCPKGRPRSLGCTLRTIVLHCKSSLTFLLAPSLTRLLVNTDNSIKWGQTILSMSTLLYLEQISPLIGTGVCVPLCSARLGQQGSDISCF